MTFTPDTARAWVDVDLGALAANARTLAGAAPGSRLLPMVKANGYGLGAVAVARALEPLEPWGYGVASVDEGAALRAAGITRPMLVVSPLLPDAIDAHLAHDLRPTIGDPAALGAWCARTDRPFHLEIDTGMARAGLRWDDAAGRGGRGGAARAAPGWEGVFTHFHSAETDAASVASAVGAVPGGASRPCRAARAGARRQQRGRAPGPAYAGDLIRPGIFLYGGDAGGPAPAWSQRCARACWPSGDRGRGHA